MRLPLWSAVVVILIGTPACTPATDPVGDASASPSNASAAVARDPAAATAARWFTMTGCSRCHAVSSVGVTSPSQMGPDLAIAVEDVPKRFGVPVEEFLEQPSGTMAIVLGSQIKLTNEQRAEAVKQLQVAFEVRQSAAK
jgi:hypothetical protein